MKFIVDKNIFEKYNNLKIGIIICNNIDNSNDIDITNEMDTLKENIKNKFANVELASYPVIHAWRSIYKDFGEKKSRSSVESLIRRTINGNDIPSINPLVDIYNLISLKYELPCGGEDLDTIDSDILLTYANGSENFISLGEDETEHPNVGEIIYKFNDTVICRSFNYRESDITKLTENTKNAIIVIESVLEDNNIGEALKEAEKLIKDFLGGSTTSIILDQNNNETTI